MDNWLALVIGNSRSHWAWFKDHTLITAWDNIHLSSSVAEDQVPSEIFPAHLVNNNLDNLPIYMASVVPEQTTFWQNYQNLRQITLKDIPLNNIYSTLGIDRALAIWGAGETYGYPCLVIDGGTALTFTGADENKNLIGGAILPGIQTQLSSLGVQTSALPAITRPKTLPIRWANNTQNAIASGVIYTIISGIQDFVIDWQTKYSDSSIVITGGDGEFLHQYLITKNPINFDSNLTFKGIKLVRSQYSLNIDY